MRPPDERAVDDQRGTAGDAARVVAVGALAAGVAALLLGLPWFVPGLATGIGTDPFGLLEALANLAPLVAVASWILATGAVLTALVALRTRSGARRARAALLIAAPGALLGMVAVVTVVVQLASWDPTP